MTNRRHRHVLPGLRFTQRFPLLALILERCVLSLVLLFAVSLLIFGGVEALPGDFATTYLGQSATPQAVANIRKDLGLDRPLTDALRRRGSAAPSRAISAPPGPARIRSANRSASGSAIRCSSPSSPR